MQGSEEAQAAAEPATHWPVTQASAPLHLSPSSQSAALEQAVNDRAGSPYSDSCTRVNQVSMPSCSLRLSLASNSASPKRLPASTRSVKSISTPKMLDLLTRMLWFRQLL